MKRQIPLFLGLIFSISSLTFAQTKTITNADLEKHRQKRVRAEREYRENYKKLGFPSPEELEKQIEESRIRREELSARLQEEKDEKEGSLQEQADALRAEIASVEAQIAYLRSQTSGYSDNRLYFSTYFPGFAYRTFIPGRGFPHKQSPNFRGNRQPTRSPAIRTVASTLRYKQQLNRSGVRAGVSIGGAVRFPNRTGFHGKSLYRGYGNPYFYGGYPFPAVIDNTNYEQGELVSRLRLLEQELAGLRAEWRVLEDQARREGVQIY